MKRVYMVAITLLLVIVVAGLTPLISLSHSGGTDGKGGHRDSSTGEYHYHHGYPAHQHPNGQCPYNYINNTSSTNSSSQGTPWYVYAIIVAAVIAWFLLDLKFDWKISMFVMSAAFRILFLPVFIIGWLSSLIDWISKKIKRN